MPVIDDEEFGKITLRRTSGSHVRFSVAPNGTLKMSAPKLMPLFIVRRVVASSRDDIKKLVSTHPKINLKDGMQIGKRHYLSIRPGTTLAISRHGLQITLTLPPGTASQGATALVRRETIAALRREARQHLPRRIDAIASQYGHTYSALRYSHASSRWGSCSSKGVISLNIALMSIEDTLIDYVLKHELAHTVHLNHSERFWSEVQRMDPDYKQHRKQLKSHTPSV
jgi:predicted metal-dependent hydrolase